VNEHHIIEMIIKDARGFPRDHRNFPIKIEGLGEYTAHHLDEEEEEIFPLAMQLFDSADLLTLGGLFEEAKGKLLQVTTPELPKALATKFAIDKPNMVKTSESHSRSPVANTAIGLGIGKPVD
jgi:hypothetical protein